MKENKYKRLFYFFYLFFLLGVFTVVLEFSLRKVYHFGDPIVYTSNPVFGYRPIPNQRIVKHTQAVIKINNLGIRANEDWDDIKKNKILFLGNSVTYGGAVSNDDLFSLLVTKGIDTLTSASAGVNAWGVENVHALIKEYGFLPADTYVSVFIESDFYRGLQRAGLGANHWYTKPKSALHHIYGYIIRNQALKAYRGSNKPSYNAKIEGNAIIEGKKLREIAINHAFIKLKELDEFLKDKGYRHEIFISPYAEQVYKDGEIDQQIFKKIKEYDLQITYLLDKVKKMKTEENFFKDQVHLNKYGHKVWADILRNEIFGN